MLSGAVALAETADRADTFPPEDCAVVLSVAPLQNATAVLAVSV